MWNLKWQYVRFTYNSQSTTVFLSCYEILLFSQEFSSLVTVERKLWTENGYIILLTDNICICIYIVFQSHVFYGLVFNTVWSVIFVKNSSRVTHGTNDVPDSILITRKCWWCFPVPCHDIPSTLCAAVHSLVYWYHTDCIYWISFVQHYVTSDCDQMPVQDYGL
jgi:hypothetical protein